MEDRRVNSVAAIARLEAQMEIVEKDMSQMKDDVKAIRSTLDSAGGSWRVLVILGSIAAAAAAALGSLATWLALAPK